MKILKIEDRRATYSIGEKVDKPIKDMDSNDVYEIIEYILKGNSVEFDPAPDKDDCPNDADRILYEELFKQFLQVFTSKDEIIGEIDQQFKEAEEFYSQSVD